MVDLLNKKVDVIYKKLIVLLAAAGGSGSFAISHDIFWFFIPFIFFSYGILINYIQLNSIKSRYDDIDKELSYE